jgi:hypothetical protein
MTWIQQCQTASPHPWPGYVRENPNMALPHIHSAAVLLAILAAAGALSRELGKSA